MSSFASRFKAGSDIAKDLINTYEMGQRKKAFGDIASAQESSDFTAEERAAMEAKANAVDANGQPIYTMGTDAQGGVTSTINKAAVPGAEEDAYAPAAMARSGVSYLGKNYDAPLSDGQRLGAQQQAMAGVLDKSGDIEGAMRYRQQAQQGVLMDKQLAQADLQIAQAKRTGAREDRADAYETSRQETFNGSVFGQQNAAYAKQFQDYTLAKDKYDAGIAAGQSPQTLGLPPQKPARAAYSLADSLADQGVLLMNDAKHGKVDAKTFGAFSESMRKIEDEGYLKALNLAQGGGSIDDVAKAFNSGGQVKFDAKSVLSDKMVPGQGGVPERVITFKDENGNTQTINVMAQLKSLGKANEVLSQFYAGETNRRGNAGEVRAEKSLGIQQAQLGLSQSSHAAAKADALAKAAAGVALYQQQNPNATAADLEAVKRGVLSAVPKEGNYKIEFGEVSQAFGTPAVDAEGKPVADLMTGRQVVNRNPAEETKFLQWMKANNITDTNKGLLLYKGAPGGNGKAANLPAFKSNAEAEAAVNAGKLKPGDKVTIGGKIATWNPPAESSSQAAPVPTPAQAAPNAPQAVYATPAALVAKVGTPPARNFYGSEAIAEREAKKAEKLAAEKQADELKAAQAKAEQAKANAEWEKMRQWRIANNVGQKTWQNDAELKLPRSPALQ